MRVSTISLLATSLLGLGLCACSDSKPDKPHLLDSDSKPAVDAGAEAERLRKMQLVKVVDESTNEIRELSPEEFAESINQCGLMEVCASSVSVCDAAACIIGRERCVAEHLLAVASGTGSAVTYTLTTPELGTFEARIPPQSAASSAAIAMEATKVFEKTVADGYRVVNHLNLEELTDSCVELDQATPFSQGIRMQALATAAFIDGFDGGKRAYRAAFDHTLAVSDAELSTSNQLDVARIRAIAKEDLSRTAAAHLMVGGRPGWFGSTSEAFCTSSKLTGPQQAALAVFREAAPHPTSIVNLNITTQDLVDSSGNVLEGSVRERLADAWGTGAVPQDRPLWEAYSLTLGDFETARNALRDEILIFGRSSGLGPNGEAAKLKPRSLPDGRTPLFDRFAGTAGKAPERPDQYWALLALLDAPENAEQVGFWRPWEQNREEYLDPFSQPITGADNLAGFVDRAYSWARLLVRPDVTGTYVTDVQDPMNLFLSGNDIQGRLMHCAHRPEEELGANSQEIRIAGYEAADQLTLVRGQDLMDCAVNGHIEGAPCELPDILAVPPSDEVPEPSVDIIRLTHEEGSATGPFHSLVKAIFQGGFHAVNGRYYLIRPRLKGDTDPGEGEWELILGTPLFLQATFGEVGDLCRDVPIVPEAIEGAAKAIAPSRDWCGTSEVSCAGTRFDERLPLEDELSTDHDDIESSWRHYLELARSAVDHADALGQEYVQAALQVDLRDEELELRRIQQEERAIGELQRVQEICGSTADPNELLRLVGLDASGTLDLSNAGALGFDLGGFIQEHPEIALHVCLAAFSEFRQTHLGNGFLCVADQDAILVAGESPIVVVNHCKDDSSASADDVGPDTECDPRYHCVPDTDGLHMFDTQSLLPDPPLPGLCQGIRQLRAQPAGNNEDRQRIYKMITEHGAFKPEAGQTVSEAVRNLGQSSVTLGHSGGRSTVKLQIGSNAYSSEAQSPLCRTPAAACNAGEEGLLCRTWDCSNVNALAELNARLYKAGAAWPLGLSRTDTLWYLNGNVRPTVANTWRVFSPSTFFLAPGFINPVTGVAFALGRNAGGQAQTWNVVGPLPTFPEGGTDTSAQGNLPMNFALRRATGSAVPFQFDLLSNSGRPGLDATLGSSMLQQLGYSSQNEGQCGVGAIHGCNRRNSGSGSSLEPGACDLNKFEGSAAASDIGTALYNTNLDYWDHTGSAGGNTREPASQRRGNCSVVGTQLFPPPAANATLTSDGRAKLDLDVRARLDAIELACDVLASRDLPFGCGETPTVKTLADFEKVGAQLECLGNQITYRAATAVYSLPEGAITYLTNGERIFDASGGSLAVAVSELRNSLLEAGISGPIIGGTLRRFGEDMRALKAQLERFGVEGQINNVKLHAEIADQITKCIVSASQMDWTEAVSFRWGEAVAGVATCANSFAQIGFALQLENLQGKVLKLESDQTIAEFSGRAGEYVTTLETQSIRLSQALEGIQRNLEVMQGLRAEAVRSLQSALWSLSRQASNQVAISTALDNIKIGKGIRYQRAFDDAKKMTFLAKRAIEMRLGMSLADMVNDLPLVTAPASWEATVCQTTGIDYAALRQTTGQGENFADSFIGDYVTKLEQVVESYRLVNNFHEGKDTAVVSLRDDVHNTRASCDDESPNRLYWASRLEPLFFRPGESPNGWTLTGCVMESAEDDLGPFERLAGNCIIPRERPDSPFFNPLTGQPPITGYDIEFGLPDWCGPSCAYQDGAALSQQVPLEPGRYRFSWYTADSAGGGGEIAATIRHADGSLFDVVADGVDEFIEGTNGEWNRVFRRFDVFESEAVTIGFERPSPTDFSVPLAGPMLEELEDPLHLRTPAAPPAFMDTTDERTAFLPVCEDTSGTSFRAQKWDHNCLKLCPDGYSSNCTEQARTECFWQTSFHLSQRSIEAGHIFNQSGFARGNFNYRIRSLGLNFVGTDLRACEDSSLPSTCNAAGFIPYSIIHDGPYYVRNHKGQDYRLALFPGRIEHARGLGIERYVTNPIGDADRTLIEPFMRSELSGRPLDGDFIIRIWEEPGVNFGAIQDVQLIIDYGYWTRFN